MIDFTKTNYLKNGNERQRRAHKVLVQYKVFEKLSNYSPVLAGTIPIEIDIESSDLDIICDVDLKFEKEFLEEIKSSQLIPINSEVSIKKVIVNDEESILLNFILGGFPIEIFGQNKPATQQNAYLHMIAEHKILKEKGEEFKQKIIALKKQGIKTEPAFGILLGLENPYEDLLKL